MYVNNLQKLFKLQFQFIINKLYKSQPNIESTLTRSWNSNNYINEAKSRNSPQKEAFYLPLLVSLEKINDKKAAWHLYQAPFKY